ncbi:uncharacterized protein PAE49_009429 [Odontesthes bonariensis]|uniref:uncharacterized protein LOC142385722 n=1 Tax=Odontesthes bonariensis TaxID=219752 RepID=UPI003F588C17
MVPSVRGEVEASPAVSPRAASLEEEEESLDGVTSAATTTAATTTPVTTPAANTGEGAMRVEEEDPVSEEPGSPKSPEPTPRQEEEEEEEEQEPGRKKQKGKGKGKGKRKADGAPKQAWSLPDEVQQDMVEWLQGNSYLWLRSSKDYHKKKSAWEMKAQEIGVTFKHLQNWWKNVKDWYVKLSKKTSGQATKLLTDRDKWVLKNIAFYKSSITTEAPDTLVSLPRALSANATASSAASAAASTFHALPSLETHDSVESQFNILEEMELAAAEQGSTTSSRRCKRRRRDEESLEEESWMQELRSTMKANQALLEKLLEERSKAQSDREAFTRYVSDTLLTAPQEQYSVMKELITDIMREGGQGQRDSSRDTQGPSSSWARPGPSASAPAACTASSQPYCSQTYYKQQQYYQPQPNYDQWSNWQYGGGQQQVLQQQHQQVTQQPLQTLNTPNLSTTSPGQARPYVASWDQASQVRQADETSSDATE